MVKLKSESQINVLVPIRKFSLSFQLMALLCAIINYTQTPIDECFDKLRALFESSVTFLWVLSFTHTRTHRNVRIMELVSGVEFKINEM